MWRRCRWTADTNATRTEQHAGGARRASSHRSRSYARAAWRIVGLALLVVGVATTGAGAATVYVANTGSDGAACGTVSSPCRTINQGVVVASNGDRVVVQPGVYGDVDGDGFFISGRRAGAVRLQLPRARRQVGQHRLAERRRRHDPARADRRHLRGRDRCARCDLRQEERRLLDRRRSAARRLRRARQRQRDRRPHPGQRVQPTRERALRRRERIQRGRQPHLPVLRPGHPRRGRVDRRSPPTSSSRPERRAATTAPSTWSAPATPVTTSSATSSSATSASASSSTTGRAPRSATRRS